MQTTRKCIVYGVGALALALGLSAAAQADGGYGGPYGFGSPASSAEIAKIDIDVMPDGRGAPSGSGSYAKGKQLYADKCAACHGADGRKAVKGTGAAPLLGGQGTLTTAKPKRTVESYWPYATTFFDFVKRAMPFNAPGSLTNDEVYSLTAFILGEGKIIGKNDVMNAKTIAKVKMPNRNGFIPDPRPDIFNYE